MEVQHHGDSVMAVCDLPTPGSPVDTDDVIKFTDSDCETILDELDTPRAEKQNKLMKSLSNNLVLETGMGKTEMKVISKSKRAEEFSSATVLNDDNDTNRGKSAFSKIKHSKHKSHSSPDNAAKVQSNHDHKCDSQKHTNAAPTENASERMNKVSSNRKEDGSTGHHGNTDFIGLENEVDHVLSKCEIKENDTSENIPKVTLNLSRLGSFGDIENVGTRPGRSSTASSNSSVRDQSSQTSAEDTGDVLQFPVSPRVSPSTVGRYSPRRVSSAELHRTPEQMVKQADRLIERTQAILERSAEAKRRTEVLLKASRERRAQARLEELASYKGERRGDLNYGNENNEHRTRANLDTNGNHESNGYDEENSNVVPAH